MGTETQDMLEDNEYPNVRASAGTGASEFNDLLSAAKTCAKWMRWWLEQGECECEYGHTCGKTERMHELKQMEAAIAEEEGR